jgi:alkylation response protein AidB-like acyl-CoA dehydrogenase
MAAFPPGADYVEVARALAPKIAACADEIEALRRLPQPLVDELIDAGLFRLLMPRWLGGAEVDPPTFVRVIETVAQSDASTAWVLCQTAGCSMAAAYLSREAAETIFGGTPHGILAWGPGPAARAVPVDGGYRVTGTFSFLSGCRHATWVGGMCPLYAADGTRIGGDEGTPGVRWMLFPVGGVTLIDVWNVIGLRGTGSDSFSVSDAFVPEAYTVPRENEARPRDPSPLYRFPMVTMFSVGFAGVALGLARPMLDAIVALARDKQPRGLRGKLAENGVFQANLAQAEAKLGAARVYLTTALEEIWRESLRAERVTVEQRVRLRLAASHAIQQATAVVDFAYHAAGGHAVFVGGGFERRFRDMHAVTQQMQGRLDHFETVGQALLGLPFETSHL